MSGRSRRRWIGRLIAGVGAVRLLGFLVVASLILPAILFAAFAYLSYRDQVEAAEQRLSQTLDIAHEHIQQVFETQELAAIHVLDLIANRSYSELRRDEAMLSRRLAALKSAMPHVRDIRVLDDAGLPLASASIFPFGTSRALSVADDEYFRVHRTGQSSGFISDVVKSRQRSGAFFLETWGWHDDDGTFRGIVVVSVEPSNFNSFFRGFPKGYVFSLVRNDGSILVRYPEAGDGAADRLPPGKGLMAEIENAPTEGNYIAESGVDGVRRLATYRKLPDHPVFVTANFGMPEVLAAWRQTIASHLLIAAPATFALFLITLLAYRQARRERHAVQRLQNEIELRQRTEAQLLQSQKMEAVGRLTGGIAHDFNNLLTVIMGNLEAVARHQTDANDRVRRAVRNAQLGAERAAALTHRLLAFSRRQPLESKPLDLNRLVSGMADLVRRTIGESILIDTDLAADIWTISADANQIENALLNLVINARDAMPEGGRLSIATFNTHVPPSTKDPLETCDFVVLSVTDTGTGMCADTLEKAFEPFFTTKPPGSGTGLGLSMVYGFMQQSGGHVRIDSKPGTGTTVELFFPRTDMTGDVLPAEPARREPAAEISAKGETVLICEDDPDVRNLTAQTLRDLGYDVVESGNMSEALHALEQNASIAVLFTDIMLPGDGNGVALAGEARRRRPDLKILFTTGYPGEAFVQNRKLDANAELLPKPFSSTELGRRMRAVLDA